MLTVMSRPSQVTYPPTRPEGTVVLVSSGVDSTICADLAPDATLVFADFGQVEVELERRAVCRLFPEVVTVRIAARIAHTGDGVFVPARNLLLACLAVHYGDRIVMGGMKDDRSIDKTPAAFQAMSRLLSDQSGYAVTVESPLFDYLKHEAVGKYLDGWDLLAPGDRDSRVRRLKQTWSCYGAGPDPCMRCKACFRWSVALRANGVDVPMACDEVVTSYLSRLWIYEPGRQWAILTALRGANRPVALVDIDGVLTEETDGRDYAARTPKAKPELERLHRSHWVLLHTARDESDRAVTQAWLERHGFPFHGLLMNKPSGDVLVDDRSLRGLHEL